MPYQVRAKTACEAVGLDRDRFNEEASAGIYPCAPSTDAGRARVFEEPDLIGLYIYARLRRMSMTAEHSAHLACQVVEQARQIVNNGREIAGDVVVGFDHVGSSSCGPGKGVSATLDGTQNAYGGTYSPMVFSMTFALGNILALVKKSVDELTAPKGED